MSSIREGIRNLAAFFVLGAVLLRLLPGESFTRYLRFFLGLILVIFLLRPVAAALSGEDLLSDVSDPEENLFGWDSTASVAEWEEVFQAYQGEILEQMNALVADLGVTVTKISVQSGGEILEVVIAREDPADDEPAPGGTESTDTEAKRNATEDADTQPEENGTNDSAAEPVKIEIPVISVFAGTGESAEAGADEDRSGETAVLIKERIAEYLGMEEEFIEVTGFE